MSLIFVTTVFIIDMLRAVIETAVEITMAWPHLGKPKEDPRAFPRLVTAPRNGTGFSRIINGEEHRSRQFWSFSPARAATEEV